MILYTLLSRSGNRLATLVMGVVVVALGGYFPLRNTFGLAVPDINWDLVWPVVLIAIGLTAVSNALGGRRRPADSTARPEPDASEPTVTEAAVEPDR
jgi:hypothetical protein